LHIIKTSVNHRFKIRSRKLHLIITSVFWRINSV
jgi:hypothetical protein